MKIRKKEREGEEEKGSEGKVVEGVKRYWFFVSLEVILILTLLIYVRS
jgi:hypothetical protein